MGLELSIQAVPEAWRQNQAKSGEDIWEEVIFMETWEDDEDDPDGQLSPVVRALISAYPGIEKRQFNLEKRWDILSFILSENRRSSDDDDFEPDIGWIAVRGEHEQDSVTGTQGISMTYTVPATLKRVRVFLEGVSDDDLRVHFDLAKTEGQEIYRFDIASASKADWEETLSCFHGLHRFYQDLREDEAVLFWLD